MLPAREGDCLWLRYGRPDRPQQVLVDGGRAATAKEVRERLSALTPEQRVFELFVITHIDRDHIEGVLSLLTDKTFRFEDIWFNGYSHLDDSDDLEIFGAEQGERLSALLSKDDRPWNKAWGGRSVCISKKELPFATLPGGLKLTVLSPDRDKLQRLKPVWERECKKAGLVPGVESRPSEALPAELESFGSINVEQLAASEFEEDTAQANGSSIALLAEYEGKKVLLTGDAHTDRLCESIKALRKESPRLKLDAFKISHHGSEHNLSQELLELIDCSCFLISTNGAYFKHPTATAMARLIKFSGRHSKVYFNYRTDYTSVWDNDAWRAKYGYSTLYPSQGSNGTLVISV